MDNNSGTKCEVCNGTFGTKKSLYVHRRKFHDVEIVAPKVQNHNREHCHEKCAQERYLSQHVRNVHGVETSTKSTGTVCPDGTCEETLFSRNDPSDVRRVIDAEPEEFTFDSIHDFEAWKIDMEKKTASLYASDSAVRVLPDGSAKKQFFCHGYIEKGNDSRMTESLGTNKINKACPSKIEVTTAERDGMSTIKVKFWSTHCGHTHGIERVRRLDKETKTMLASTFKCMTCDATFRTKFNLNRHLKNLHDFIEQEVPKSTETEHGQRKNCKLCDRTFSSKYSLTRHMNQVHQVEDENKRLGSFACPLCNSILNSMLKLQEHIQKEHDVSLEIVTQVFESVDEFQNWKRNIEKEDLSAFVKLRSKENKTYYGCHRSGSSRVTGTGKRPKSSPSCKIGSTCPARMKVTNIEGRITVNYCKTHVGHCKSIQFLHLTKEERDELAEKIKNGVTFDCILDDIRKSIVSSENIRRWHLVNKRDLFNIVRDYSLDRDVVRKNNMFDIDMWVQEQMVLEDNSPVLYFEDAVQTMEECETNNSNGDANVSASSRLIAILSATIESVSSASDEGKLMACKKIEEALQILQSNKNHTEISKISGPH